jgi:hypothetical protein
MQIGDLLKNYLKYLFKYLNTKNNFYLDFKKKIIKKNFFLSKFFIKYQNVYLKKDYKIKNFLFSINENLTYIPFTSENINKTIHLSFYSLPITVYSKKQLNFLEFKIVINKFLKNFSFISAKYNFLMITNYEELSKIDLNVVNPFLVEELQIINLNLDENKIFDNMKLNHKNEIKKILKVNDIEFKIYDHNNYLKGLISSMMKMHEEVSGRKTRSLETWNMNEEMIQKKMAFIVEASYKKRIISYSFFYHNLEECCYFSSVTVKDSFNLGGINHAGVWHAIKFAKKLGLKRMKLGTTKYLYSRNKSLIDEKRKNIAFFKSRFCGETEINITIDEESNIKT